MSRARSSSRGRSRLASITTGPADVSPSPSHGSGWTRRSKWRTSIATPFTFAFSLAAATLSRSWSRPSTGANPRRAAAIASTPEPVPTSSNGPAGDSLSASSNSSSRHSRVVACPPVPNACPGSITISCTPPSRSAVASSQGGRTCRAGTRVPPPAVPRGASISTGRWNRLQRSCQSSGISLVEISTSDSPTTAFRAGRLGSSPGAP